MSSNQVANNHSTSSQPQFHCAFVAIVIVASVVAVIVINLATRSTVDIRPADLSIPLPVGHFNNRTSSPSLRARVGDIRQRKKAKTMSQSDKESNAKIETAADEVRLVSLCFYHIVISIEGHGPPDATKSSDE